MDEKHFENALSSLLKRQDPDRLCKILVVIRNNLEGSFTTIKGKIEKIHEEGCVKDLVSCLQQRKIYIINLTLSILSRCCMDSNFARLAINRHALLSHLNSVLKRNETNSVRIRVFRIIGNMCEHWDRLANTVIEKESQLHLVLKVVDFLKATEHLDVSGSISVEEETAIILGIRTLRELGHKETIGRLIDLGALKAVGIVLNKFTSMLVDQKSHQELAVAILKFFYNYSKYRSPKLISELQDISGKNVLTNLGKMIVLNPFLVLKIMINLINVTNSRSDLPFDIMSKCLIEKLENTNTFNNGSEDKLFREYLKCLCFFVKHPAIRGVMKNAELIPALLQILQNLDNPSDLTIKNCAMILSMLNMYMFDDALLSITLQNGVTNILMQKMRWLLDDTTDFNVLHEYKTKSGRPFRNSDVLQKNLDSCDLDCSSEMNFTNASSPVLKRSYSCDMIFERNTSPCSEISLSIGSLSPLSSPTMSEVEVSESDSDDYSPVCSDAECDLTFQDDLDETSSPRDDIIERTSLTSNETPDNSTKSLKKDLAVEIVKLIKSFTLIRPVAMDLLNPPDFLVTLLKFCLPWNKHIRPSDTLHYVGLIAKTPEYLVGLMKANFIVKVFKMTESIHDSSCSVCQDLYTTGKAILNKIVYVVERKCGKGDIAHQLYRGSMLVKRKIVPIIPYIIDNVRILSQLLRIGGGLDILLQIVQEDSDLQDRGIAGLSRLSKKLGVINPTNCKDSDASTHIMLPIDINGYKVEESAKIVYFKLDDGSVVEADRDFLCNKSHYFRQLLSGTFKESHQTEFEIDNKKSYKIDVDLNVLLDAIVVTDRYLMEDYCLCLSTSVQLFKFLPTSISSVYEWSLQSGTDILRIESVAYSVVADMSDSSRCAMFKSLLQLGHNEHFVSDIRGLLDRYFTCNLFSIQQLYIYRSIYTVPIPKSIQNKDSFSCFDYKMADGIKNISKFSSFANLLKLVEKDRNLHFLTTF